MFGFRPDGKKIKKIDPIMKIVPHIMPSRHDSQNSYLFECRCEGIDNFIRTQRENGVKYNYMHLVIASIVRLLSTRPDLNRFVMNGRVYQRNEIEVSFVVKKALQDNAAETTIKLKFDGSETVKEVKDMVDSAISSNNNLSATNSTDTLAKVLTCIPNFVIKFLVGTIKWMDKHGMLPKALLDIIPFHTSAFVTNLKSIKIDYIYHHLYDFGTTSLFVAMGKEQLKPVVDNGEIAVGKIMKLGIVTDERFCDGFYYARSLRIWDKMLQKPEVLLEKGPVLCPKKVSKKEAKRLKKEAKKNK